MWVESIPVAHTPPGGWSGALPEPVLSGCTDPIIHGAPDMSGMWQVVDVLVEGEPIPGHQIVGAIQRIEQAADRVDDHLGRHQP